MNSLSESRESAVSNPHDSFARDVGGWLMTVDPVRVAWRHAALAFSFVLLALAAGMALRFELLTPALDHLSSKTFGTLLSMHGTLMMYFIALPVFPGVLAHAMLPGLLGNHGFAFPRLMRASWHLLALGGLLVAGGFFVGGTEAGWTFDTSFGGRFTSPGILPAALGVFLSALSMSLMGINIATTIQVHRRATGSALAPLASAFLWSSLLAIVAGPVLATCTAAVIADRLLDLAVFAPAAGGDPAMFATLFSLFTVPAQNMILLAALGVVAQVILTRTRSGTASAKSFGRAFAVIAAGGVLAWGGAGMARAADGTLGWVTLPLTALIAVAAGLVILLCLNALRKGILQVDTPMVYALGFLVTLSTSLIMGLLLSMPVTQRALGNTTFATAHLHTTMTALLGMAFLAGLHDAWPRLSGRRFSESAGKGAAALIVLATPLSYLPVYAMGRAGASFRSNSYSGEFQVLQVMAAAGASLLLAGVAIALINLIFARRSAAN